MHTVDPLVLAKLPTEQAMHVVASVTLEYVPSGQS